MVDDGLFEFLCDFKIEWVRQAVGDDGRFERYDRFPRA